MANTKIPSELIADSSITAAKLADGTITTADIADSNVTTAKIADSNVTTAKIGDAQVTTAKITDANVTTGKIADDAVTTAKMASNSVTSDTIASGITLAGTTTLSSHLVMGDNGIIKVGDSSDLEIFHNGTTNVIRSTTSNIELKVNGGGNFKVGDEFSNYLFAVNDNSDVQLYHGITPALKLATTSTGIDVTGNITVSGTVDGVDIAARDSVLTSTTTTAGAALPKAGGTMTGNLVIQSDGGNEQFVIKRNSAQNEQLILGFHSSDYATIQSIEQGVAYRNLALNPSGGNVGIGTTAPGRKLHLKDGQIKFQNTGSGGWAGLDFSMGNGTYDGYMGMLDSDGKFFIDVDSNGNDFVILQNGNVGIGTDTPAKKLEIFGSGSENGILVKNDTNTNYRGYYISSVESDNTAYGKLHMDVNSGELNITAGYSGWGGFITFDTNGSEKMQISTTDITLKPSNGTVIVDGGTADYEPAKVELQGRAFGGDITAKYEVSDGGAVFFGSTTNHDVRFIANNTERWRFNTSGHFTPAQQHTYDIGGTNAEVRNIYAQGISFASNANASGMSSELLDDYEEGTYTATISCASGSISLNTSFDELRYTKIGKLVHVQGRLACSGVSNPTGATNLNLPFTSTNDTNKSGMADNVITGYFNGSAITNGIYTVYGNIDESSSNCRLFVMIIPVTNNLGDNHMAGGSDLYVNFTYTAA